MKAVFLQILNSLLEKAKKEKKMSLIYGDINDAFKGFEFDEERDGRSLRIPGSEKNIDIINNILKHRMTMMSSSITRKKKLNCWMMLMHWKGVNLEDPVRMYLKEIGSVKLYP